jgi:Na+-transporting NADH:ubiquinone oxidoreductase subunit NqrB
VSDPSPPAARSRAASGAVLILVGVVFFLRDPVAFAFHPERWWAGFLFVPVVGVLARGGTAPGRRNGLRAAMIAATLGVLFLLTPGVGEAWPLLLVGVGLASLL